MDKIVFIDESNRDTLPRLQRELEEIAQSYGEGRNSIALAVGTPINHEDPLDAVYLSDRAYSKAMKVVGSNSSLGWHYIL